MTDIWLTESNLSESETTLKKRVVNITENDIKVMNCGQVNVLNFNEYPSHFVLMMKQMSWIQVKTIILYLFLFESLYLSLIQMCT